MFESYTWISSQPRTFGRFKCAHTCTCERSLIGSVWRCWWALRGAHWETDVPHRIPQLSTHMHACTHSHTHTHTYRDANKRQALTCINSTDLPYFLNHMTPKISARFPGLDTHMSVCIQVSLRGRVRHELCRNPFPFLQNFEEILMHARKRLHTDGWVYQAFICKHEPA